MKTLFISFNQMIISFGIRLLSSCLKKAGYQVELISARAVIGKSLLEKIFIFGFFDFGKKYF